MRLSVLFLLFYIVVCLHPGRYLRQVKRPLSLVLHGCLFTSRTVRCSRRSNGEAVLSEVHGRVHPEVVAPPSHRRRLLWHGVPTHAVHGPSWVQTEACNKPIRSKVSVLLCSGDAMLCFCLFTGCLVLKYIHWHINCNNRRHLKLPCGL